MRRTECVPRHSGHRSADVLSRKYFRDPGVYIKAVLPWLKMTDKFQTDAKKEMTDGATEQKVETGLKKDEGPDTKMHMAYSPASAANVIKEIIARPKTAKPNFPMPTAEVVKVFGKSYDRFMRIPGIGPKQVDMLDYFMSKLDRTLAKEPALTSGFYIIPKYEPHWGNLVEWLRSFHEGEVARYQSEGSADFSFAVSGMFDLVELEKEEGRQWDMFQRRLDGLRGIMGENDEGWLQED